MIARAALVLVALVGIVRAQELPRPWLGSAIRGQVVDADTATPIAGAVLVARWTWLDYQSGGWHGSSGFNDRGEALHVSESVSDAQGRFTLAGFGPTVRVKGQVEENAPQVTAFKSGYEPFQQLVGKDPPGSIRLKRHTGTPSELAAKIAAIQGDYRRGLHWLGEKPTWSSTPRMVEALHREDRGQPSTPAPGRAFAARSFPASRIPPAPFGWRGRCDASTAPRARSAWSMRAPSGSTIHRRSSRCRRGACRGRTAPPAGKP